MNLDDLTMPPEKVAARRSYIGASDLPVIMGDNDERKLKLWQFKRGAPQDDLSDVLPVMMGCATEAFNLAWFEKQTGLTIDSSGFTERKGIVSAAPDAVIWDKPGYTYSAVIDAKHVGTFKSDAEIGAYYAPQLYAQMHVFSAPSAYLSVLKGNADWFYMEYQWDETYGAAVVAAAEAFWRHCQDGTPPAPLPIPAPPKPKGVVEYSFDGNNAWAASAADYTETLLAHGRHEAAKKQLKELVPAEASKVTGHGITISRAKNGALRFVGGE